MASLVMEDNRLGRTGEPMPEQGDRGNGGKFQLQDHERRLSNLEKLPITEMRVDLQYLKNELAALRTELREQTAQLRLEMKEDYAKVNSTVTWILRTLVAACLTLLMGVLIWVLNGGPPD